MTFENQVVVDPENQTVSFKLGDNIHRIKFGRYSPREIINCLDYIIVEFGGFGGVQAIDFIIWILTIPDYSLTYSEKAIKYVSEELLKSGYGLSNSVVHKIRNKHRKNILLE